MVKLLHELGASLNIKNEHGSTPLHIAVFTGNTTISDYRIKNGARVDATDKADKQPLHDAVYTNKFGVIKILVAAGADVNALDGDGFGALHIAAFNKKCPEQMRYLIEHDADVDLKSRNKEVTPILVALSMGYVDGIAVLLEKGCDIDICDIDGSLVLHQSKCSNTSQWTDDVCTTSPQHRCNVICSTSCDRWVAGYSILLTLLMFCLQTEPVTIAGPWIL